MKKSLAILFGIFLIGMSALISAEESSCENRLCKVYLDDGEITYEGNIFRVFLVNNLELGLQVNGVQSRIYGESQIIGNLEIFVEDKGDNFIEFSFVPLTKISEEGNAVVKKGYTIEINGVSATVREISWALSGDTEPRVILDGFGGADAQYCSLKMGESCKLNYGAVAQPTSKNLKITAVSIEKNEANPDESTATIALMKIKEDITPEDKPLEIPEETSEGVYFCQGCELESKCYPFGYRKGSKYCSDEGQFFEQAKEELSCENNFECESNVCVNSKCVSGSLIEKIINWFKKLFGAKE